MANRKGTWLFGGSRPRTFRLVGFAVICFLQLEVMTLHAAGFEPGKQRFKQEIANRFQEPKQSVDLLDLQTDGTLDFLSGGRWYRVKNGKWVQDQELPSMGKGEFIFRASNGKPVRLDVPWSEVRQLLRLGDSNLVVTVRAVFAGTGDQYAPIKLPSSGELRQAAVARDGSLWIAAADGLWQKTGGDWQTVLARDSVGRLWSASEVLGLAFDSKGQPWFATRAGVGCRSADGWKFFEGKDGLPWNDFTCLAAGPAGEIWLGTHLGAIRRQGDDWHYRQGPCWLTDDNVRQVVVDETGNAWFATAKGLTQIEFRTITLSEKAEIYEDEIRRYIKRTPYGYVAEAALRRAGDRSSADPQDSDNDGLWTAMYGAGECFGYAATSDLKLKERAKAAFEALRFLQKVTQGGTPAPPKGFVARTIRPVEWPDPNQGRLESDREEQKHDKFWKAYEPRWPKSADGKWFWKSDTSSDELDGHYFFYPLYYELCADTDEERERVREVVRELTDHLVDHDFLLVDHDGTHTRWGVYSPAIINHDPFWCAERGLNSLSMLSYLTAAAFVTRDPKYTVAARTLIDDHGYAQNLMFPKIQHGPGSGNQSDDEMAFMCYYTLLRYSKDETLKTLVRYSYYRYWANEAPEMNPFFNFAYAAENLAAAGANPWGTFSVQPWPGWHQDAMTTLYGLPLDRLDWSHHNSHRLDLQRLPAVKSVDISSPDSGNRRGYRVNGKVLPVENRFFTHWNTDPWELDYGGRGSELGAGTVFLLPYYMGLYHGFIEKP